MGLAAFTAMSTGLVWFVTEFWFSSTLSLPAIIVTTLGLALYVGSESK